MRAVIDTNILIRALIKPGGTVGPVLSHLAAARYVLIYSEPLLNELVDVLGRPRIRGKYHLTDSGIPIIGPADFMLMLEGGRQGADTQEEDG